MDHPMIGKIVTFGKDGNEGTGKVDKAKAGPMFLDGKSKVGEGKVQASVMLHIVPDDGGAPFWAGPFQHKQAASV